MAGGRRRGRDLSILLPPLAGDARQEAAHDVARPRYQTGAGAHMPIRTQEYIRERAMLRAKRTWYYRIERIKQVMLKF